ncbi:MAG: polysaccharide deacetylase family protein [Chloroflexaceae bacterium]|nr:polysaccharide deacetylase family protein [Chloroflexaceae bacterium]
MRRQPLAPATATPSATPGKLSGTDSGLFVPLPTTTATATPVRLAGTPFTPPLNTPAVPGTISGVPILMYHYVRERNPTTDALGYRLSIAPAAFAAQLDWLARNGYTPMRLDTALGCMQGAARCPPRPVVLTFDDGYMDAYTAALPLLQQYGFVATFNIVSGFVGRPGYMGTAELLALRDAGMELAAHSATHPDLTLLDESTARAEIGEPKRTLEALLGVPVTSFCYPAGKFDARTVALVQAAGYTNATTTLQHGDYRNPYTLPRLRITGGITLDGFAALMQGYR